MKFCLLLFLIPFCVTSQTTKSIINEVNLDSLVSNVLILSGEKPDQNFETIPDRNTKAGRMITATFLENQLKNYGLEASIEKYSESGSNVIAIQKGVVYPDSILIISAHYDSVTLYCADDDASGTSTVLEAARILSKYEFEYTIIYALWDEEEIGLLGSRAYAQSAAMNADKIVGNLNMDMIGYDGNDDHLFEVHLNKSPKTLRLYNELVNTFNKNNLDLELFTASNGITNSDHSSFWNVGYGAILITEAYTNNDFNPNYHNKDDRIEGFNLEYYHEVSKLTIATLTELANLISKTDVAVETSNNQISVYPNPVNDVLNIDFKNEIIESIEIIDITGKSVFVMNNGDANTINTSSMTNGIYTLLIKTPNKIITKKFIKLKN